MVNVPNAGVPITGALAMARDWYKFFTDLVRDIDSRQSRAGIAGVVAPFAGTTEPTGWLFCYGQAVSRTTYAALFTALGTTYGTGDGTTTFNLPDLRGRVVAGQDDMGGTSANRLTTPINGDTLGASGGSEGHQLTAAQQANMTVTAGVTTTHTATPNNPGTNIGVPGGGGTGAFASNGGTAYTVLNISGTAVGSGSASGGSHNNVQPTIILNYIICTGI